MKTEYLKLFEKFCNDEMKPDEKSSFENILSADPEMNLAFREYLSIYEAISDQEVIDLRIKLKEIREERNRRNFGSDFLMHNRNWLWLAALITFIISFTVIVSLIVTRTEWKSPELTELKTVEIKDYDGLGRELSRFKQRNTNFNLLSPEDSAYHRRRDSILFQWSVDSTDCFILDFIDWEGTIVYTTGKPVESPYLLKKKLPEGAFVFRFRTETESYYLGYLLINR